MQRDTRQRLVLELKNIGPLKQIQLEIKPGINIIRAPNASGKTSLIRGFTSMFSDQVPPAHILALDEVQGRIAVQYGGKSYVKTLRRTPSGSVVASGPMMPSADHRAFDACVAMAETGVVHKITGGGAIFREYLENLSYGKYYSTVSSVAQELVNEMSRELASQSFERFESLPLLVTELTNLYLRREQAEAKIASLRSSHENEVQDAAKRKEDKKAELVREEATLSELRKELNNEKEKEQQLKSFLELTDDSAKVAAQIKNSITDSKRKQEKTQREILKESGRLADLKAESEKIERQYQDKISEKIKGLYTLEMELQRLNKAVILKEEAIQQAEKFPEDDPKYGGRLVVEVRKEAMRKIEWLNRVIEYFQEKYMRRMTSAKLRFNRNVNRAFRELELKGFENVFLDQNFGLHVVRENGVRQPIETLSASEKLTVSLILMLAAKETFLPDFPFFILDELTLSYDPARLKHIVNYIKQRVPYVIVTSLTSEGTGRPTVAYET
jgi:DNA repair exonuclease SbcCD ATPase subunit